MGKNLFLYKRRKGSHIAPVIDSLKQRFRITHPFHPLFSREFDLLEYRKSWGRDSLNFIDDQGRVSTIPLEWTDAGCEQDPFVEVSAGRSFFRAEDLIRLADLVKGLKR